MMPTRDALELAMDRGMDLIEVAPNARPPVCRIGDYGRLKYDRKKREAEARKNRSTVQLKEIKVRPKTDDHDMAFKIKNAMRFLGEGNKVKITVRFRGREHAHHDIGAQQCMRLFEAVELDRRQARLGGGTRRRGRWWWHGRCSRRDHSSRGRAGGRRRKGW